MSPTPRREDGWTCSSCSSWNQDFRTRCRTCGAGALLERSTASPFDAVCRVDENGEHWSGRALQPLMDYSQWRDFATVIEKAKSSLALVQGTEAAEANFADARNVSGSRGPAGSDYRLTRFAAYLTAMAGDDTKEAVAHARVYFATKTREAEIQAPRTLGDPLDELELSNQRLGQAIEIAKSERAGRIAAETERDRLAPPAQAWNTLASADGDLSVADAAKVLSRDPVIKLGERRLFTLLGEHGWAFRQRGDGRWRASQDEIDAKRMSELPQSHYHPRTGVLVLDAPQVRVTVKGLGELHRRLGGTSALALSGQLALIEGSV